MEAWLKFTAPGITISLGLGIGRIVFSALNKIEWVFALAILINLFSVKGQLLSRKTIPYFIPLIILVGQTIWLLPELDARAEIYIDGVVPPPSNLHVYFVILEILKVTCLMVFGLILFKKSPNNININSLRVSEA